MVTGVGPTLNIEKAPFSRGNAGRKTGTREGLDKRREGYYPIRGQGSEQRIGEKDNTFDVQKDNILYSSFKEIPKEVQKKVSKMIDSLEKFNKMSLKLDDLPEIVSKLNNVDKANLSEIYVYFKKISDNFSSIESGSLEGLLEDNQEAVEVFLDNLASVVDSKFKEVGNLKESLDQAENLRDQLKEAM